MSTPPRPTLRARRAAAEPAADDIPDSPDGSPVPANAAQTAEETKRAESKFSKLLTRLAVGLPMIGAFYGIIYLGHGWVTWMVATLQTQIFRELVNVRYNNYRADKRKMLKRDAPRFRTIQWGWFFVAMFYSYGHAATTYALLGDRKATFERLVGIELGPTRVVFDKVYRVHQWVSFILYSVTFVVTILSFKRGIVKYQFEQLTWTLLTIIMVVSQMNLAVYNIFEGLFWFLFPCSLVVCNDCFAYFCGFAFGGKIFKDRKGNKLPFLPFLSPNKTWEGFIGAFFCTCIFGFAVFPKCYAAYPWLYCPLMQLPVGKYGLNRDFSCTPPPSFQERTYTLLDLFPDVLLQYARATPALLRVMNLLEPLAIDCLPVQWHGLCLAAIASTIAPFGGFFASAMKRAYNIKDFDSFLPGHGGITDRMDCQFIMNVGTYVYFQAFVKTAGSMSVSELVDAALLLPQSEQQKLLQDLQQALG